METNIYFAPTISQISSRAIYMHGFFQSSSPWEVLFSAFQNEDTDA